MPDEQEEFRQKEQVRILEEGLKQENKKNLKNTLKIRKTIRF